MSALRTIPAEADDLLIKLRRAISDDRQQQEKLHEEELQDLREQVDVYRALAREYHKNLRALQQQVAGR
jgi:ATP/maltotriose-dependent transcriptional regulator MalT